jgi:hypothetical protein
MHKEANLKRSVFIGYTKTLSASFEDAFLLAKYKKPRTLGKALLLPAAMICEVMRGEE